MRITAYLDNYTTQKRRTKLHILCDHEFQARRCALLRLEILIRGIKT